MIRAFFKKRRGIADSSVGQSIVISYRIKDDLLAKPLSDFTLDSVPELVEIGDIMVVYEDNGNVLFTGVINALDEDNRSVSCGNMYSLFDDKWMYSIPSEASIEETIETIISNDFANNIDSFMRQTFNFAISCSTSTAGTIEEKDAGTIVNFQDFLIGIYNQYDIVLQFKVYFDARQPEITILKPSKTPRTKLSNNVHQVIEITARSRSASENKLIIYSAAKTTYRGTYYVNGEYLTINDEADDRLSLIKTKYVFSDDNLSDVANANLSTEIYNHELQVIMTDGFVYNTKQIRLGNYYDIYYKGEVYKSVLTGIEYEDIHQITMIFGKVRQRLEDKINALIGGGN